MKRRNKMEENKVEEVVENVKTKEEVATEEKVKVPIKLKDLITMGVLVVLVVGLIIFGISCLVK
jgi:putative N-acetylmannosamine-6-phosphate epimerase